jgi:hypothetical protein
MKQGKETYRSSCCETADSKNEDLLNQSTTTLSKRISDNINSSLSLGLTLAVKRNVGHFLAGIKQGIFGTLTQNILSRTDENRHHQGCKTQHGSERRKESTEHGKSEESKSSDSNHL